MQVWEYGKVGMHSIVSCVSDEHNKTKEKLQMEIMFERCFAKIKR